MGPEFREYENPVMIFEGHVVVKSGNQSPEQDDCQQEPVEEIDNQDLTYIE